ncbi:uncharacterized protein LOC111708059 [Eurytemora carolleeae]|uniref:uncharacterized protein LOC111708059 n=1 Tax=Eurytemora carolleeae TaxID=1294199 RepID=UPI000C761703|nr:uncharacterized protein LOC111708059 [Eurytemora carolleeae]|eukprot:XP_023337078.1 uncharacterized protein LOC111708059 [Eurytemora affinis]
MNGELVQHDSASSTATISTTAEVHSDKLNKLESTGNTTKEARSMESDGSEVRNSDLEVGIPGVDVGNADSEVGNCGSEVENTGPEVGNSDPEVGNSGGNGFTDHSAIIFESRTKGIMKESDRAERKVYRKLLEYFTSRESSFQAEMRPSKRGKTAKDSVEPVKSRIPGEDAWTTVKIVNPNIYIGLDLTKNKPVVTDKNPHLEGISL